MSSNSFFKTKVCGTTILTSALCFKERGEQVPASLKMTTPRLSVSLAPPFSGERARERGNQHSGICPLDVQSQKTWRQKSFPGPSLPAPEEYGIPCPWKIPPDFSGRLFKTQRRVCQFPSPRHSAGRGSGRGEIDTLGNLPPRKSQCYWAVP